MPMMMGSGSQAMMRSPMPASPSTAMMAPAMKLAPTISGKLNWPESVPR